MPERAGVALRTLVDRLRRFRGYDKNGAKARNKEELDGGLISEGVRTVIEALAP